MCRVLMDKKEFIIEDYAANEIVVTLRRQVFIDGMECLTGASAISGAGQNVVDDLSSDLVFAIERSKSTAAKIHWSKTLIETDKPGTWIYVTATVLDINAISASGILEFLGYKQVFKKKGIV